ncbi:hypothetical protein CTAYLR_009250 [Chrysophaeum taylorii]|uniref:Uncharacterized protein n=1 Tax=Chrysophaeum taylorii TaxID=2483200 RepID=A0AAD7UL61_9STRA|nr:hypothetical protein CTAYLR_009250 [Chrysophaeum taylorii]
MYASEEGAPLVVKPSSSSSEEEEEVEGCCVSEETPWATSTGRRVALVVGIGASFVGLSVLFISQVEVRGFEEVKIGGDFVTSFDRTTPFACTPRRCQWTNGNAFCVDCDEVAFGVPFEGSRNLSGAEITLRGNSECSCESSNVAAGHLSTREYFGYGRAVATARFLGEARGSSAQIACFALFSELGGKSSRDEMNFCVDTKTRRRLSLSWVKGSFTHSITYDPGFDPRAEFREYALEWNATAMRWAVDGEIAYERMEGGCGRGPAIENATSVTYSKYENGEWHYEDFFGDECEFSFDPSSSSTLTEPMQIRFVAHPLGAVSSDDIFSRTDLVSVSYENHLDDRWRSKWDGYRYDCWTRVGGDSKKLRSGDCGKYGVRYFLNLAKDFFPWILALILGVFCGTIFGTCARLSRRQQQQQQQKTKKSNLAAAASWTPVGIAGIYAPRGSRTRCVLWVLFLAILAASFAPFAKSWWHLLSLRETEASFFNTVVLGLALMQTFHFIALLFTPLPSGTNKTNNIAGLVGVVIPCHRSAKEIAKTIESVLAAGILKQHVVVVDNANAQTPPDNTMEVVSGYGVHYQYVPIGLKSLALKKGVAALPATAKFVLHIDDDTILPESMIFDGRHFDTDPAVCAVSYGIVCFRDGTVQRLVDFELALWSHWRLYRAKHAATAWFCHGIAGLWRRDRLAAALEQHPYLPFGEDGWLGAISLANGDRISQELRCSVVTFAPPRLFPGGSRLQGYGAASVWKQRSMRWFVNAPRRLPYIALWFLFYSSSDRSFVADLLFRVEVARHVVITMVILAYPCFLLRVFFDNTWLDLLYLKLVLFVLDLLLYAGINYILWRDHRARASLDTVLLYPFYRTFLRAAYVFGHWRCILYYIPCVPMRTGEYLTADDPFFFFKPTFANFFKWLTSRPFYYVPDRTPINYQQPADAKKLLASENNPFET